MRFSRPLKTMAGVLCLSSLVTAFNFGNYMPIISSQISKDNKTVNYQPNPLFEACTCDLTSLSCDANCCCDQDCSMALRSQWVDGKTCTNANYEYLMGAPLAKCVSNDQIYKYNREKGLSNYIDPFTKLFCVYIDNSPTLNYYYQLKSSLGEDEVIRLSSDTKKQGFEATLFAADQRTDSLSDYTEGMSMRVSKDGFNSYFNGFQMPRTSINGMCDNFKTPLFMQNSDTECTQTFDIQNECDSLVNPLRYINQVVKQGSDIAVKLIDAYSYDPVSHTYSQIADLTTISDSVASNSSGSCQCKGAVKEVHYTVKVTNKPSTANIDREYFQIESINATAVVCNNPITGKCGSKQQINQRYSINFITSFEQGQFKSGNPGYIIGAPLLVGNQVTSNSVITAYEKGFQLKGADHQGRCLSSSTDMSQMTDFGDPVLGFGEDTVYGCSVSLSLSDLSSYCGDQSKIVSLPLFQNLDFFDKYGQFGNANIYKPKDWKDIIMDQDFALLGSAPSAFSYNSRSCQIYSSVNYKVYYAKMGYTDNPQNYVVDIHKTAKADTWAFRRSNETDKQIFNHYVSIQYIEISPDNISSLSYTTTPENRIPADFWYPFYIHSSAYKLVTALAVICITTVFGVLI